MTGSSLHHVPGSLYILPSSIPSSGTRLHLGFMLLLNLPLHLHDLHPPVSPLLTYPLLSQEINVATTYFYSYHAGPATSSPI